MHLHILIKGVTLQHLRGIRMEIGATAANAGKFTVSKLDENPEPSILL
jgi:hypothetical protein